MMQEYSNDRMKVTYDPKVCTHSGNCVKSLASVFDVSKSPWINVDGAGIDEIEAAVKACPSGALGFERQDS